MSMSLRGGNTDRETRPTCGEEQHVALASSLGDRGSGARLCRQSAVFAAKLHGDHEAAAPDVADGEAPLGQRHQTLSEFCTYLAPVLFQGS